MAFVHLSEEEIAHRLQQVADAVCPPQAPQSVFPPELLRNQGGEPRPAAVLVPLLQMDGEWHLLFTRRTNQLPEHSGQVAFPGGRMDPEDTSPETTALREAQEEIGLNPEGVRILGRIDSFLTITSYCVTPVLGIIVWPTEFVIAPAEVSRVFTIPLRWLADPVNVKFTQRELPPPYAAVPVIYFSEYDGEILWGVSAQIVVNLLKILFEAG
jgi:8-oxo-dGTP pyrophosphatase MutT (NUDIX family)